MLGGQADSIAVAVASFVVWTLIGQFMLFVLFFAYLIGNEEPVVTFAQDQWARHRALLSGILYSAGFVVVIALITDAVHFFVTDSYLWG